MGQDARNTGQRPQPAEPTAPWDSSAATYGSSGGGHGNTVPRDCSPARFLAFDAGGLGRMTAADSSTTPSMTARPNPSVAQECNNMGLHAVAKGVLYVAYTDPAGYPPLHHSARILADSGFTVLTLGIRVRAVEALR